jgi:hypothetical protein
MLPYICISHGQAEIVIHFPDEMHSPALIVEWQLILFPSFEDRKQSQVEDLEDLRGMRGESDDPYTGIRDKSENGRSEVR